MPRWCRAHANIRIAWSPYPTRCRACSKARVNCPCTVRARPCAPLTGPANGRTHMYKILCAASMLVVAAFPAVAQTAGSAGAVSPEIVKDLAPTGKLRAAINLGNAILAHGSAQEPRGLTVDLARELARRTGLALELVTFEAAGKVFEALKADAWDIAFIAIEPVRAAEID